MIAEDQFYKLLADVILVVHFGFVAFVVMGLAAVWVGYVRQWTFVRNFYFRLAHLVAMGFVAAEAVAGVVCPLTAWEERLRVMAGSGGRYEGSFIEHWVHQWMFFDVRPEVFTAIYVAFFALIVLSLWVVRPRWPRFLVQGSKFKAFGFTIYDLRFTRQSERDLSGVAKARGSRFKVQRPKSGGRSPRLKVQGSFRFPGRFSCPGSGRGNRRSGR